MKKALLLLMSGLVLFMNFSSVSAATCVANPKTGYVPKVGDVCLDNPLGSKVDATVIIGTIIKGALGILGSLALLMLIWGGFQWMTSAGNTEKVEKGTSTMLWAIIGVVLVLSSYILVNTLTTVLSTGSV
ncbi:MAG: pilin [Patescibacteria group bacterium]|jgi:hypothetical protein